MLQCHHTGRWQSLANVMVTVLTPNPLLTLATKKIPYKLNYYLFAFIAIELGMYLKLKAVCKG